MAVWVWEPRSSLPRVQYGLVVVSVQYSHTPLITLETQAVSLKLGINLGPFNKHYHLKSSKDGMQLTKTTDTNGFQI